MAEHAVATVGEIREGKRKIVQIGKISIGVFNIKGEFFAIKNICPHKGAPLCKGSVQGMYVCGDNLDDVRLINEGEILRCPWHGWEFDIKSGKSIIDPNRYYVKNYEVTVDTDQPADAQVETFPTSIREKNVIVHV
ncbi:Rieske (2Fe-2S) protein [Salicibibacter cibarius]|uniref:Rieske (2Fe-2S) protein n=1 Tax=Salicibibacter cibarius TaxID=2743000 RepID=A0A7T6Z4J1_9BACI|nr:Rieske (2Fe-2S) protein [Salicibibacter cibarius]QQK76602.1 Rieske (2Fe-2S) protein [Salicibibacter cibarius]